MLGFWTKETSKGHEGQESELLIEGEVLEEAE
jgi:hypothetical protein